jgi:hypothetical protein
MYVFHPKSFKNMLTYIIVIKEEKKKCLADFGPKLNGLHYSIVKASNADLTVEN